MRKCMDAFLFYFYISGLPTFLLYFYILENVCQFRKRRAPNNDADPFDKISQIMDMRPISIKKHEWMFANRVHICTTKHNMVFWKFGI